MLSKYEIYITDVMKGKRHGLFPLILKGLLRLMSWPFRFIVFCRNFAYDHDLFRQYQPPIPLVISVGNIVAGGSGKTPVTLLLAKEFYENATLAILSRGYRSPAERLSNPVTLSVGKGPLHSAAYCGDEPYMLAENLPKAFVFVGKDRHKSVNMAAKAGVDIALLDDGMQHRRIGRDYELVVMDVDDPFGQGFFLPRGLLRESPKSLQRADLIILNHIKDYEAFERSKELVREHSMAPVVGTRVKMVEIYDLAGKEVNTLRDKRVAIFCGIAHPERLVEMVKEQGAQIVGHQFFPDHYPFYQEQIAQLAAKYQAAGVEMLVCTEKDKVKISEIPEIKLPIVWVKIQLFVVQGKQVWEKFISRIKSDLPKKT